jgi:hypothetical protein
MKMQFHMLKQLLPVCFDLGVWIIGTMVQLRTITLLK